MKKLEDIKTVVIAGAGLMGASMAQIFALWGYTVIVYDIAPESIRRGKDLAALNQKNAVAAGNVSPEKSRETLSRITFTLEKGDFAKADFVVEAIVENLDLKRQFWGEASAIAPADAILTTNTSGLSITEIAKAVEKPERFAGMHWVNPPHIVPLVEAIAGEKTAPETVALVCAVAESIHRKPIQVRKDPRGFVLNRLQYAVLREAANIVEQGYASMEDVDNAMKYGLGMRYAAIGPFETVDLGGLDTFFKVGSYLFADLCNSPEVPRLIVERYKAGDYGTKTGRGFYDYPGDKAAKAIAERDRKFLALAECLYKDL
jgi:3-hydroxybutyryl-CoA dehydrogenase